MCDKGDCVANKLQNVFVSLEALEDHYHAKHRRDKGRHSKFEKANHLLFGFNQGDNQHNF